MEGQHNNAFARVEPDCWLIRIIQRIQPVTMSASTWLTVRAEAGEEPVAFLYFLKNFDMRGGKATLRL